MGTGHADEGILVTFEEECVRNLSCHRSTLLSLPDITIPKRATLRLVRFNGLLGVSLFIRVTCRHINRGFSTIESIEDIRG